MSSKREEIEIDLNKVLAASGALTAASNSRALAHLIDERRAVYFEVYAAFLAKWAPAERPVPCEHSNGRQICGQDSVKPMPRCLAHVKGWP